MKITKKTVSLLLMLALIFALSACGGGDDGEGTAEDEAPAVVQTELAKAASAFMDALKKPDLAEAATYFAGAEYMDMSEYASLIFDEDAEKIEAFNKKLYDFDYAVIDDFDYDDGTGVVKMEIKSYPFTDMISELSAKMEAGEYNSGEDTEAVKTAFMDMVDAADKTNATTIIMKMQKVGETWVLSEEFTDVETDFLIAISGGLSDM